MLRQRERQRDCSFLFQAVLHFHSAQLHMSWFDFGHKWETKKTLFLEWLMLTFYNRVMQISRITKSANLHLSARYKTENKPVNVEYTM